MGGTVTNAGAQYIAQKTAAMEPVVITKFILANISGANENTVALPESGKPSASLIKDQIDVVKVPAYNSDSSVTYSLVLNSDVGDYDFNYYGLITDTGVLLAFAYIPTVKKRAGIGQVINRNAVVTFTNAKYLTGADLPVESWQFDWEPEMAALQLTQITNSVAQMSMLNTAMATHERLLKLEGKL